MLDPKPILRVKSAYQSVNFRSTPEKPADNVLFTVKGGKEFATYTREGEWFKLTITAYAHESVMDEYAPKVYPVIYPEVPYRSQWDTDGNGRDSDCGQACVAMLCESLGVYVAINSLPYQTDQRGYTIAANLKANAATVGIGLLAETYKHIEDIQLPAILLVHYGKFPNSEVQDVGFNGLHWLILRELLPDGRARVNDPDYWGNWRDMGENKLYSAKAVADAFRVSGVYQTVIVEQVP